MSGYSSLSAWEMKEGRITSNDYKFTVRKISKQREQRKNKTKAVTTRFNLVVSLFLSATSQKSVFTLPPKEKNSDRTYRNRQIQSTTGIILLKSGNADKLDDDNNNNNNNNNDNEGLEAVIGSSSVVSSSR